MSKSGKKSGHKYGAKASRDVERAMLEMKRGHCGPVGPARRSPTGNRPSPSVCRDLLDAAGVSIEDFLERLDLSLERIVA